MKEAPEYALAKALITLLQGDEELGEAVMAEPWDQDDQNQNLAMAAGQHGVAVAVCPQRPVVISEAATQASYMQARVAVVVLTTTQVLEGTALARLAAVSGRVLASCLRWDYSAAGIPYAEPAVLEVQEVSTESVAGLNNLLGTAVMLGWRVNYKQYYK